jgi:hypothetical protein
MTPMMVCGWPLTVTVRPTTAGSAAYRRCQTPWLSSSTPAAPGRSSSGRIWRPRIGCTPIIGNMFQLMVEPLKRSGSSLSDSVRLRPVTVAMSANDRVRAFQSCTSRYDTAPRSIPLT